MDRPATNAAYRPDRHARREGIEGHGGYATVTTSPANDAAECECGWRSDGYHDMTSYAHHDWLRHVDAMRAQGAPS